MRRVRFSPGRVALIAAAAFREAVRLRLLHGLLLLALAFVAGVQLLRDFNFGTGELKFIADFGYGSLVLFGSVLTITVTAALFWRELELRTVHAVLAKPVWRPEFVLGKFLGAAAVAGLFCAVLPAVLAAVLWARAGGADGGAILAAVASMACVQFLKLCVLAAFTLLIASFAHSQLFTVATAFLFLVVCHLQYLLQAASGRSAGGWGRALAGVVAVVVPDFQRFAVEWPGAVGAEALGQAALWAAAYVAVACGLAAWIFQRREI